MKATPGDGLRPTVSVPIWFGASRRLSRAGRGYLGIPEGTSLCMSLQGRSCHEVPHTEGLQQQKVPLCACVLISSHKDASPIGSGPSPKTSFNLNDPVSKHSPILMCWELALQQMNGVVGGTVHFGEG